MGKGDKGRTKAAFCGPIPTPQPTALKATSMVFGASTMLTRLSHPWCLKIHVLVRRRWHGTERVFKTKWGNIRGNKLVVKLLNLASMRVVADL